jgi:hypothetical protein
MTRIRLISNIFLLLLIATSVSGQRFNFGLKGGLNFSQVNGDALAGYDKLGFEGGVKSIIYLEGRWDLSVELLYSQRGSASEATFSGNNAAFFLTMNYISIPLIVEFKDWEVREDDETYYRMHFNGGLAYGRLFDRQSTQNFGSTFNTDDLSFLLGLDYYFNSNVYLSLRYTRSIIPLQEVEVDGVNVNVIPHQVTVGAGYMFL